MENQLEGAPNQEQQPEVRQGLSDSFMNAMNPPAEEVPAEPVAETTEEVVEEPAAEENVVEVGEAPLEGETPAEAALEVVEEDNNPAPAEPVQEPTVSYDVEGLDELAEYMRKGGTMQGYLELNKDYTQYDDDKLLEEYYKKSRPHLDSDDRKFILADKFKYDEELDDEADIRKKKIAAKEELFKAKQYLEESKNQYKEIKSQVKGGASPEDIKAAEVAKANKEYFDQESDKFFDGLKGFDFQLGENKPTVRYRVDNAENVKSYQSDIMNVVGEFLDDSGKIADVAGYHKALFAAKNADKIAQLFYDQGKADAVKDQAQNSKNTDFSPQHHEPSSNTKLAPGQAREIAHPNAGKSSSPKVRLSQDFWKK